MPHPVTEDRLQTARFEVDIAGERTPVSARLA
jgi:hypothetical protein